MSSKLVDGQLTAKGMRFALVVSRFSSSISSQLLDGALDTLIRHGASRDQISIVHVPGSFEIPLTCKRIAESGQVDAIVALGAIIRGATSHYEHVCNQTAAGIMQASLSTSVPITFGVLTTDTIEQAIERSGTKAGNKGCDAALAAIEMVSVLQQIEKGAL